MPMLDSEPEAWQSSKSFIFTSPLEIPIASRMTGSFSLQKQRSYIHTRIQCAAQAHFKPQDTERDMAKSKNEP
jgi:hypothetical protein